MALFDKLKSKLGIGRTENPAEPDKKEEKAVPEAPKAESVAPAEEIKPAADQLTVWAERAGVPIVKQKEGADPAAVVFDGIQAAKQRGADVLIVDTAGRLHNKSHLMEELKKIARVISREFPEAKTRSLLVIDATTGQNGLAQAEVFKDVADLEGIILTKLDGTAKGGIAIAIRSELGLPVRYIGVGEQLDDLRPFDAKEFIDAIL